MDGFDLGSPIHAGIVLAVTTAGTMLGMAIRRRHIPPRVLMILAVLIAGSEIAWYGYVLSGPWPVWPGMLPLHLCDVTVWLTAYAALRRSVRAFGVAYYWGLAGTTMALLTPDVQGLSWNYPTVQFFVSHGLVVSTLLAMAVSGVVSIDRRSWWRALLVLHAYALAVAAFNVLFGTNYLYLKSKPSGSTLLDLFGPWPWYLLIADAAGAVLFYLLWLPFARQHPAAPKPDGASH